MMVLVSYDVSTTDAKGRTRLRKVAKTCQNYGQRVQNSVFEIDADYGTFLRVKDQLLKLIDEKRTVCGFIIWGIIGQGAWSTSARKKPMTRKAY